jgi:hypothetical protein
MAFVRNTGKAKIMYFPKTASTAIPYGAAVVLTAGQVALATSSTANILGVSLRAVVSTDSDYASTTLIPVEVPCDKAVEWLVPVSTGSATAASVGVTYDLTDSAGINVNSTSQNAVIVTRYISATQVAVVINKPVLA